MRCSIADCPGGYEQREVVRAVRHGDRIIVVERWQDESTLAAHFMHPNFLATKDTLHDLGSGKSVIRKYRVDISEPVRDSEKRYRADFFTVAEERS